MAPKEIVTESVISVFQAVLVFVLFDGCFDDCCYEVKKTSGLIEISMSRQ